jgi:hypothetical protein
MLRCVSRRTAKHETCMAPYELWVTNKCQVQPRGDHNLTLRKHILLLQAHTERQDPLNHSNVQSLGARSTSAMWYSDPVPPQKSSHVICRCCFAGNRILASPPAFTRGICHHSPGILAGSLTLGPCDQMVGSLSTRRGDAGGVDRASEAARPLERERSRLASASPPESDETSQPSIGADLLCSCYDKSRTKTATEMREGLELKKVVH